MSSELPSIKHFLFPILQVLVEAGRPLDRPTIARGAADRLQLSEAQRAMRIPSGRHLTFRHRTGWALQELKHAGLAFRPEQGRWAATPAGRDYLGAHPGGLTDQDIAELRKLIKSTGDESEDGELDGEAAVSSVVEAEGTPQEIIEEAIESLRQSIAAELLQRLHDCDPITFERIVLDVLHGSGYGASREMLRQTASSGDGGIDGIISLDRLGLEKVYVQAKRWQNPVGRPELQSFFGALSGRKANKGVFITTSDFTAGARDYARSVSDTLVLVNGAELVQLMIDCRVGVIHKSIRVPELDADYFADE
jgi:restriction system protein